MSELETLKLLSFNSLKYFFKNVRSYCFINPGPSTRQHIHCCHSYHFSNRMLCFVVKYRAFSSNGQMCSVIIFFRFSLWINATEHRNLLNLKVKYVLLDRINWPVFFYCIVRTQNSLFTFKVARGQLQMHAKLLKQSKL